MMFTSHAPGSIGLPPPLYPAALRDSTHAYCIASGVLMEASLDEDGAPLHDSWREVQFAELHPLEANYMKCIEAALRAQAVR